MNYPPAPHDYNLAVLRAQGKHKTARKLLANLNRLQVAFGHPEYDMPAKAGSSNGLVTCPAHVPIVETIVRPTKGGGYRVQEAA